MGAHCSKACGKTNATTQPATQPATQHRSALQDLRQATDLRYKSPVKSFPASSSSPVKSFQTAKKQATETGSRRIQDLEATVETLRKQLASSSGVSVSERSPGPHVDGKNVLEQKVSVLEGRLAAANAHNADLQHSTGEEVTTPVNTHIWSVH